MGVRTVRLRLLEAPNNPSPSFPYPDLAIIVSDTDGKKWLVPSLAEGIAFVKSTRGRSLYIRERTPPPGEPDFGPGEAVIMFNHLPDDGGLELVDMIGGDFDFPQPDTETAHDLSSIEPTVLPHGMTGQVVIVEVEK